MIEPITFERQGMPESTCVEIRSGGMTCIRFVNIPKKAYSSLLCEFGGAAISLEHTEAIALVTVVFEAIYPPANGIYIGRTSCATPHNLFVREGAVWASLPMADLLDPTASVMVVADPAFDVVRLVGYLLEPIAKIRALLHGHSFVHSSAVAIDKQAVLLCAWGNTGKTNLMLQFAVSGATMLSDDWSLLMSDGTVAGYPRPVNLMNYNLDIFPQLRSKLSKSKHIVYVLDRIFRHARARYLPGWPSVLRVADLVERLLETGANARLPLESYDPSITGALAATAVIEVHKVESGASESLGSMDVNEAGRSATICFAYENIRFLQRIAEYSYAIPGGERMPTEILSLYRLTITRNLMRAAGPRIHSIGIPSKADLGMLIKLEQEIRACCLNRRLSA